MTPEIKADSLRAQLDGRVLLPGESGYDDARRIWNVLFDRHPALIVRPVAERDVATAVRYARSHGLEIAIKGGGHHAAGYAATQGGMLLDMSGMTAISLEPEKRTVRLGTGLTWAHFDQVTQSFGLACNGPIVSMTGVAGFTLGGGMGWLHRKLGLGCDSLKSAKLVTATGERILVSEAENSDLLWGLKGSGWNFGVVTEMELNLHPIGPMVTAGLIYFPLEEFPAIASAHAGLIPDFPDELTTWFFLRLAPPVPVIPPEWIGKPVVAIALCHCGSEDNAAHWAEVFSRIATPIARTVARIEYRNWQRSLDPRWGNGFFNDWRGHYLNAVTPQAVDVLMHYTSELRSQWTDIKIPHLGGAVRRVPDHATAYGNRNAEFGLVIQARWEEKSDTTFWTSWARELRDALEPHSAGGVYANFIAPDESGRIPSAHGAQNYSRLQELKARYDPANLFHINPNIPPK
jgi:FAD/FMN-containing dehydrogenase